MKKFMRRFVCDYITMRIVLGILWGIVSPLFYLILSAFISEAAATLNYTALAIAVPITSSLYGLASWCIKDMGADINNRLEELASQGTPVYLEQIEKIRKPFLIVGLTGWILSVLSSATIFYMRGFSFLIIAFLIPFFGTLTTCSHALHFETCPECHALCSHVWDGEVPGSERTVTKKEEKKETYTETVGTIYDKDRNEVGHVSRDRDVKFTRDVTTYHSKSYYHCRFCGHKGIGGSSYTTYGEWK